MAAVPSLAALEVPPSASGIDPVSAHTIVVTAYTDLTGCILRDAPISCATIFPAVGSLSNSSASSSSLFPPQSSLVSGANSSRPPLPPSSALIGISSQSLTPRGIVYAAFSATAAPLGLTTHVDGYDPRGTPTYRLIKDRWISYAKAHRLSTAHLAVNYNNNNNPLVSPFRAAGSGSGAAGSLYSADGVAAKAFDHSQFYFQPLAFTRHAVVPVVMLAFPIINRTNHFVGVGEIELRLEALHLDAVGHLVPGTEVFVTDRAGTVVATSHPSLPTYTSEEVPANYQLPPNDRGRCTTAVFDDSTQRYRRCLLNATTYGHAGLAEAYAALPEETSGVVKRRFGGAEVIAGVPHGARWG